MFGKHIEQKLHESASTLSPIGKRRENNIILAKVMLDYQNRTGNQKILRELKSQRMIPRDTITLGLDPLALYPQLFFTQLRNTSDCSSSPNVVAVPKAMGIVPSCLELGERAHFLMSVNKCKEKPFQRVMGCCWSRFIQVIIRW